MNITEKEICSTMAKSIKEHFGRGPLKIEASINPNFVLIYASGHMVPFEIELSQTEAGCQEVKSSRSKWIDIRKKTILEILSGIVNRKLDKLFYDFDPKTSESVIICFFQ